MRHLFRITDDDRVVPMHSFKHAATLQHTLPHNPHPLLLRVDKKAGHGGGKSTEKRYIIFFLGNHYFPIYFLPLESKRLRISGDLSPNLWDLCGKTPVSRPTFNFHFSFRVLFRVVPDKYLVTGCLLNGL
jgi:hypothetical protein